LFFIFEVPAPRTWASDHKVVFSLWKEPCSVTIPPVLQAWGRLTVSLVWCPSAPHYNPCFTFPSEVKVAPIVLPGPFKVEANHPPPSCLVVGPFFYCVAKGCFALSVFTSRETMGVLVSCFVMFFLSSKPSPIHFPPPITQPVAAN